MTFVSDEPSETALDLSAVAESSSSSAHRSPTKPATVDLLGLPIHHVSMQQAVGYVVESVQQQQGGWVMTPNVDILRRWKQDASFRTLTSDVSLCIADGMPLVWASRLGGQPLPQRLTGADLTRELLATAAERDISVFFLGGAPGTAEQTADVMRRRHPSLRVAGTFVPPYGFEHDVDQWHAMQQAVTDSQAELVFVALGSPKQEIVISRLRTRMPGTWWLGVGATFDFISGRIRRAPVWMQRCGMEWLHRLGCEPRRLAHRYLVDDVPFAARLLLGATAQRLSRVRRRSANGRSGK